MIRIITRSLISAGGSAVLLDVTKASTFETFGFSIGAPFEAFPSYLHWCSASSIGYSGRGDKVITSLGCFSSFSYGQNGFTPTVDCSGNRVGWVTEDDLYDVMVDMSFQ